MSPMTQMDLHIMSPISFGFPPSCLCIAAAADASLGPGIAGAGSIRCGAGSPAGVDLLTSVDHHTNDADSSCTSGTLEGEATCVVGIQFNPQLVQTFPRLPHRPWKLPVDLYSTANGRSPESSLRVCELFVWA